MFFSPAPPPPFEQESWYHGDITGAGLEIVFSNAEPGQYVVRASTSRVSQCLQLFPVYDICNMAKFLFIRP